MQSSFTMAANMRHPLSRWAPPPICSNWIRSRRISARAYNFANAEILITNGTRPGHFRWWGDWNLLEHEAIFELPIVMPGNSFELVIKADKPGMFMYMCMVPRHMQFGMMGMMMAGESMM